MRKIKNLNSLKFDSNLAYGYSVDNLDYMGSHFNKAARLPKNFKIHKSSIDEIVRFNDKTYLFTPSPDQKPFENIDLANTTSCLTQSSLKAKKRIAKTPRKANRARKANAKDAG
ncbi:Cj0814 family flagellar-dependent secreted protein [Campylobacter concisus]|uniref:Cj0814 family flagellar-dependent secreted protein n=1 Tax=Campylobacter concisus TaxID=199 RepID=UPI00112FCC2F